MENLITLILSTLVISGFCLGWRTVISEGAIFNFFRKPFEDMNSGVATYIMNPLVLCVKCMPSVWGTLCYLTINHYDSLWNWQWGLMGLEDWLFLVIAVVTASFVSIYWWNKHEG